MQGSAAGRRETFDGVSVTVDRDGDAVVWLEGRLTVPGSAVLVAKLEQLLRDADCVIVDVSELAVEHPATLGVLPMALLGAGGWPVAKLAVRDADGEVREALLAAGAGRMVAIAGDPGAARRLCDQRPAEVRARQSLPGEPASAHRARRFLQARLELWGYPAGAAADVVQAVNELVTNTVEHARTQLNLEISLDDAGLRCSVRDYSTAPPVERAVGLLGADAGHPAGLGLYIVSRLAGEWGCTQHPDGKTVWALFDPPP